MSSDDFHSLNQVIQWLQQLYDRQKKGKLQASFEIKHHLCYEEMPDYQTLTASSEHLCRYAAKLFSAPIEHINILKKSLASNANCLEITVDINNETNIFFIKQAWEGAIKEAIGLEFNNLLTDTPIRYLCSSDIIMTEKVFEPLPTDTLYQLRESNDYMFAYGIWEIFTRLLRLTDRKTTNIRWNGLRLANIDFGLVFYKGNPVFDSRFTLTKNTELRKQGQQFALKHLLNYFQQHRTQLETLLLNIDVHFCRNIHCSRTPREPLKVILTALKEISAEIDISMINDIEYKSKTTLLLKKFVNIKGVLYIAVMTYNGFIIDELKAPDYQNNNTDFASLLLNNGLMDLIVATKNNSILNNQIESIQIDLTEGKLLMIWNKKHDFIMINLLKFDASVAHIKANMRKIIESY